MLQKGNWDKSDGSQDDVQKRGRDISAFMDIDVLSEVDQIAGRVVAQAKCHMAHTPLSDNLVI